MRRYALAALLPAILFLSLPTFAQPIPPTAPVVSAQPATPAPDASVAPAVPVVVPDVIKIEGDKVTVNDIITNAGEVATALKALKDAKTAGDKTAIRLGLMLLLAAIFKVLLSLLKFTSEWWKTPKAKTALRLSTLVLGVLVFFTAKMGLGESWMNAAMLAVSGPLAIAFHELYDIVVQLSQKKPAAPAGAGG